MSLFTLKVDHDISWDRGLISLNWRHGSLFHCCCCFVVNWSLIQDGGNLNHIWLLFFLNVLTPSLAYVYVYIYKYIVLRVTRYWHMPIKVCCFSSSFLFVPSSTEQWSISNLGIKVRRTEAWGSFFTLGAAAAAAGGRLGFFFLCSFNFWVDLTLIFTLPTPSSPQCSN